MPSNCNMTSGRAAAIWIVAVLFGGCGALPGTTTSSDAPEVCNNYPTIAQYQLPWQSGQTHTLVEGNCGSNLNKGLRRYGYDFAMPAGTVVAASRAGTVTEVTVGNADGSFAGDNVVRLLHADGTYGNYYHLQRQGAVASVGSYVAVGTPLGMSGDTGFTAAPGLHFEATARVDGLLQSVPISFSDAGTAVSPLAEGSAYPLP